MIRFPWQKKNKGSSNDRFTTSIVPVIAFYPDKEKKADEILKWLVEIKAVKPELSECIWYMDIFGHAIDIGAKKLSDKPGKLPFNQERCGLEIVLTPRIFDSGDAGLERSECPVCKKHKFMGNEILTDFLEKGISKVKCEGCECEIEINEYNFSPNWAFSDLGFTFWEWKNLKESFISEFEKRLGCKVKVVECFIGDIEWQ